MYNPFKSKAFETPPSEDFLQEAVEPQFSELENHQWQLIARSYAPPAQYIPETLQDAKLVEKAMFGVTTILLQDINTGAIRKEEILGSDENQLFVILDKADRYGMQYIPFNGKRFAVALVPPEDNVVA